MPPLSPFPVDFDVMSRIRPMLWRDVSRVVTLHKAMGHSLWAELGTPFLMRLYHGLLKHPEFIGFVYEEPPRVMGMIAGTGDSSRLFDDVLRNEGLTLAYPVLRRLLTRPALLRPLLSTSSYFQRSSSLEAEIRAESLFCSFEPGLRGKRISGHINKVLFDELLARGHRTVKITNEVDNAGSARQLTSWGFARRGTFRFYGKDMVVWVLDLEACERVQPVSRYWGPDPRLY